jgi:hypothetical protein
MRAAARAAAARRALALALLCAAAACACGARRARGTPAAAALAVALPSPRPRVHLATYAGCTSAPRLPAFAAEASASGFFDVVSAYSLPLLDAAFVAEHSALLAPPPGAPPVRGCGYWVWKPQAVLQELRAMSDGDVLVYADAGASLHAENCAAFWGYVALAAAQPSRVVSFEMASARAPADAAWCKADAAAALGVNVSGSEMRAPQLHSTYFFMARSDANLALVTAWRDACVAGGYHLVDDSASVAPNAPSFVEHRHDQCLFSLLRKTRRDVTGDGAPAALLVPDDGAAGGAPIQSTRCRTGAEAGCALRRVREAVWAWARERVPGYESVDAAAARRACAARRRAGGAAEEPERGGGRQAVVAAARAAVAAAGTSTGQHAGDAAATPAHAARRGGVPQLGAMTAAARGA